MSKPPEHRLIVVPVPVPRGGNAERYAGHRQSFPFRTPQVGTRNGVRRVVGRERPDILCQRGNVVLARAVEGGDAHRARAPPPCLTDRARHAASRRSPARSPLPLSSPDEDRPAALRCPVSVWSLPSSRRVAFGGASAPQAVPCPWTPSSVVGRGEHIEEAFPFPSLGVGTQNGARCSRCGIPHDTLNESEARDGANRPSLMANPGEPGANMDKRTNNPEGGQAWPADTASPTRRQPIEADAPAAPRTGRPLKPSLEWQTDHYRFRCRVKGGGRPWVHLPVGLTKSAAERMALKLATMASNGSLASVSKPESRPRTAPETVEQWAARWMVPRAAKGMTSVYSDGKRLAKWVYPTLGARPIAAVTKNELKDFVTMLDRTVIAAELSAKSAMNIWGLVSKMFSDACASKDRTLCVREDNPADGVRGPDRGTRKVKTFLYPSEVLALLACERVSLSFRRVVALATYLGLRSGELKTLRWEDLDLDRGIIQVHRGFDRMRQKDKATKGNAARKFTMEPAVLPLLRAMKTEGTGEGRVTPMPSQSGLSTALRDHLRKAGVDRPDVFADDETRKHLTFHDLRASALTWMAARGDDPLKIKARAGHADLQTTEGYVRTAGEVAGQIGDVFPPLPSSLLGEGLDTPSGPNAGVEPHFTAENTGGGAGNRTSANASDVAFLPADSARQRLDKGLKVPPSEGMSKVRMSKVGALEEALANALTKATAEGRWDAVVAIAEALRAGG